MSEHEVEGLAGIRQRIKDIDAQVERLEAERALLEETIERVEGAV